MGRMKEEFMRLSEEPIMDKCQTCEGAGTFKVDVARPQSFDRDVGYLDTRVDNCETCAGSGEMERLCACGEWVTQIRGEDATVCDECI